MNPAAPAPTRLPLPGAATGPEGDDGSYGLHSSHGSHGAYDGPDGAHGGATGTYDGATGTYDRATGEHDRTTGEYGGADPAYDGVVGELVRQVLGPLPRRDQRRSGELYIRGLLATTGRKSIRNIASRTGAPADAQRLHHLVSDSTWPWRPLRAALAAHMVRLAPPTAWVVHTATTPRTGRTGVGTDYFADPRTGRSVNAQRAVGLWAAGAQGGYPVDWHLRLTARWLDDPRLRRQAGIPEEAAAVDEAEAGIALVLNTARATGPAQPPVLLDARHSGAGRVAARLAAAGIPYLLRISTSQLLVPLTADGRPAGPLATARQLAAGRPTGRWNRIPAPGPAAGVREVARLSCRAADAPPGPRQRQVLLVQTDPHARQDAAFWLTDLVNAPVATLVRLAATPARVARDVTRTGRRVGLYDFEGHTFAGWHRHITLASAAHAAALLARAGSPAGSRPLTDVAC
ncbi:transposase [Streptomyces sp. NPDC004065]|uniref:IS701 family transposase n=1 Tax=Streptomyces sp. NPDC004065 TaxID=3364689 RepID=UPI00384E399D